MPSTRLDENFRPGRGDKDAAAVESASAAGANPHEERLRLLEEASRLLGESLDWEATLAGIARLVVPRLADWCIVDVLDEEVGIRQVAIAAADPRKEEVLREMRRRYAPSLDSPQPAARALRDGRTVAFPEFTPESLKETVKDEEHYRLICEADPRSAIAVPLVARGHTLGALTFSWSESDRRYGDAEIALAEEVANRAALAVDNARLYRAERESRATAEAAQERLVFLAEASETLSASLDYGATLTEVARLAVPRIADWCVVYMLQEDGSIARLAVQHFERDSEAIHTILDRFPLNPTAETGVPRVLRTRESELHATMGDRELAADVDDPQRLASELGPLEIVSWMCVPLVARNRTLGAIAFISGESGCRYGLDDLALAEELARRAALAVDNARLYHEAESTARRTEEALALLDTLFATAPIGLGFWDPELRCVRINEALAAINGLPVEEHLGRRLGEVLPELAPMLEPVFRRILETGEPVVDSEISGMTRAAPGEIRHWLTSYYPVRAPSGEPVGLGAVVNDITDRKRGEEVGRFMSEASALLNSSLDYETTLASLAELAVPRLADWCTIDMAGEGGEILRLAVAHVDPAKVARANELQEKFAPTPDAPYGVPNVLRTGTSELFSEIPDELLVDATEGDEELLGILRELGLKSSMCVPLIARGRVLGAITLISDQVGRRFDQSDLATAEELARRAAIAVDNARLYDEAEQRGHAARVLAHVADGVFLLDGDDVVRLWNPAAEMITGLGGESVVGRAITEAVPGWAAIRPRVPVASAPATGGTRAETVPLELPDREVWLSISGVDFAEGTVYAFRDLTEERALEELKSEFVSTVSHELRTPLAAIYGAALTLRRGDVELAAEQRDNLLAVVASEADRLARTVNDILWASRVDSETLQVSIESCDAVDLARSVVAAAHAHLPTGIDLVLLADDDLPFVSADPDKVRQVLVNLVDNAIKYSPDGGRVDVRLERDDRMVRFAVHDEGLGIPPPEQRRIFDKFYRLDPNLTRGVGGTGLGLYICRELIQRMGGRIWVDSRQGDGSSFSFELPTSAPAASI